MIGSMASLLRFVAVKPSTDKERVTISFGADALYRRLKDKSVHEIAIQLKTTDDQFLPLTGSVRVTLHIR